MRENLYNLRVRFWYDPGFDQDLIVDPPVTEGPVFQAITAAETVSRPMAAAPDGSIARVASAALNLRSGPGNFYAIYHALPRGSEVQVLGQSENGPWIEVRANGGTVGWLARRYMDFR